MANLIQKGATDERAPSLRARSRHRSLLPSGVVDMEVGEMAENGDRSKSGVASSRTTRSVFNDKAQTRERLEEWASEVLAHARILLVGLDEKHDPIGVALRSVGCGFVHVHDAEPLPRLFAQRNGVPRVDGAVLTAGVRSDAIFDRLRQLDPALSILFFGDTGLTRESTRLASSRDRGVLTLERPAARYEILECVATLVLSTKSHRDGHTKSAPVSPLVERAPSALLSVPTPDLWPAEDLRRRIRVVRDGFSLKLRETQALRGSVRGLTNPDIANQLGVSVHDVKKFMASLLAVVQLRSRYELPWLLASVPDPEPNGSPAE
jgi:DNA-binding CsgD family transcriptional regulator